MSTAGSVRRDRLADLGWACLKYLVVAVLLAVSVLPFLYVISVSFRLPAEFYGDPHWIPREPTLEPWRAAFEIVGGPLGKSAIVASGTAVLSMAITIPGAYVFGRKEFPGKQLAFYAIITVLLFPYILLVIPISATWHELGLFNTIPGLWIAYQAFVTPFAIWILRDFYQQLPFNLEEAARVYGCTQFSAFRRVILPLSLPATVAVGFLAFVIGWNDFLFSNMLTTGTGPQPAVVTLFKQQAGGERTFWAQVMAMTLMIGFPPTVLYLVARRYITETFAV